MTVPEIPPWTYSGDPTDSDRDELRFIVQDTDPSMQLMTDVEMDYLLGKWMPLYGSITYVAALAASVISRKFAGVVDVSADGVSVSTAGLAERYREMAQQLRQEYQQEGAVSGLPLIDNILAGGEWDDSIEPLEFGMHVHDNPAAGRQAYGGWSRSPRYDWDSRSWK